MNKLYSSVAELMLDNKEIQNKINKVIRILIKNRFAYKPDDATILYNDIVSDVRLLKSYKEVIQYLSVYGITDQYLCCFI